jgi:TRAP-type C4-dicarboxylate transport system permease small subunit
MRRFKRVIDGVVSFVEETLPSIFLVTMVLIVFYSVVSRYAFARPIGWANQATGFLFVWTVFLGAAAAGRHYLHIGVEVLANLLPGRWRAAQMAVVHVVVITVLVLTARLGMGLMQIATKKFDMLGISYFWVYLAIPIGFLLLAVHEASRLVDALRGLWTGDYTAPSSVAGMTNLFDEITNGESGTVTEGARPTQHDTSPTLDSAADVEQRDPKGTRS